MLKLNVFFILSWKSTNLFYWCFSINVVVRRVGGGYGGKITRSCQIACSAALVTHLLGRTCRFILPLQTGMKIIGKRLPTNCNFQVSHIQQHYYLLI